MKLIFTILLIASSQFAFAGIKGIIIDPPKRNAADIIGVWLAGDESGKIKIFEQNGKYFGKVIWSRDRELPEDTDFLILKNYKFKRNRYIKGKVIDPESMKAYKSSMKLSKNGKKLIITARLGFLSKKIRWTRIS